MINLALTTDSSRLTMKDLVPVASAINKQISRDFLPVWNRSGTIQAFPSPSQVPAGYIKVLVTDKISPGALGYYSDDGYGLPYAVVLSTPDWSVTVSHEILEILMDPSGNTFVNTVLDGKKIQALVEVCDPSEDFAYSIDGIAVSDFLLPRYYDWTQVGHSKQTFMGILTRPLNVARGGYFSFIDTASDHWYQRTNFDKLRTVDMGPNDRIMAGHTSAIEALSAWELTHPNIGE